MKKYSRELRRAALLGAALAAVLSMRAKAQAPAAVSGQVTILERPGETTEDLGNVVVFLEPIGAAARHKPATPSNSVINLQSRQFRPRVTVVMEGSTVAFPNLDPFSHNVFSKTNGGFDTGVYGRGKTRDNVFQTAGVYSLYCNVHPRMAAYVVALQTPFFVQAGLDGRFTLENVPPGRYRLHAWHDRTSEVTRELVVPASGAASVRVELDARGYKYVQHKNKFGQDYTSASGDRY